MPTGKRPQAEGIQNRGAPKVQTRYWQVRMKLSGKKDPAATISGKFPAGKPFRKDTDGAILRQRHGHFETALCPGFCPGESLRSVTEGAHVIHVRPLLFFQPYPYGDVK